MIDYDISSGDARVRGGDVQTVDSGRATRQRLKQKFDLWAGEWFLNTAAGFPWLSEVLGDRPRPEVVRSLVHDLVADDPGIRNVQNIDLEPPGAGRALRIRFTATLADGSADNMEFEV